MTTLEVYSTTERMHSRITQQIRSFHANKMDTLIGEIWGHFFWAKKAPFRFKKGKTNRSVAFLKKLERKLKKRFKSGNVKPELTLLGSTITRNHHIDGDNRAFHLLYLKGEGWKTFFYQEYCHFGYENEAQQKIVTYCEGDVKTIKSSNEDIFEQEKSSILEYLK